MANEIQLSSTDYNGTLPLYGVASLVSSGQFLNGVLLENFTAANWSLYAIALTLDTTSGLYQGDFPGGPNGLYSVSIRQQLGGSPASTDTEITAGQFLQATSPTSANADVQMCAEDYAGTRPLYFVVCQGDQFFNRSGSMLEAYNASNWAMYTQPLSLANSIWSGSFPPLPDGDYYVAIHEQIGATPSPGDNILVEAEYPQRLAHDQVPNQLQLDAIALMADFGEPIVYQTFDDNNRMTGSYPIDGLCNRNPPSVVQEDGKVLTDDVEICIVNHPTLGRPQINKGRDKILVSGRYGGIAKQHLVTTIVSGNAGMWDLRVK